MKHTRVAVVLTGDVDSVEEEVNLKLEQLESHKPPVQIVDIKIELSQPHTLVRATVLITYTYDSPKPRLPAGVR